MADKPAPEEKKIPAAEPAEPKAAEPRPRSRAGRSRAGRREARPEPAPREPARRSRRPPRRGRRRPRRSRSAAPSRRRPRRVGRRGRRPVAEDREALRAEWADEAERKTAEHDKKVRRFLLRLSLANWGIAIVAWTISAFLGITSPASIIVYSVLFVIGLVAAILAILLYLLEKFGHEPQPVGAISADEGDGDAGDGDAAAAKGDTAAPAAT